MCCSGPMRDITFEMDSRFPRIIILSGGNYNFFGRLEEKNAEKKTTESCQPARQSCTEFDTGKSIREGQYEMQRQAVV